MAKNTIAGWTVIREYKKLSSIEELLRKIIQIQLELFSASQDSKGD